LAENRGVHELGTFFQHGRTAAQNIWCQRGFLEKLQYPKTMNHRWARAQGWQNHLCAAVGGDALAQLHGGQAYKRFSRAPGRWSASWQHSPKLFNWAAQPCLLGWASDLRHDVKFLRAAQALARIAARRKHSLQSNAAEKLAAFAGAGGLPAK